MASTMTSEQPALDDLRARLKFARRLESGDESPLIAGGGKTQSHGEYEA